MFVAVLLAAIVLQILDDIASGPALLLIGLAIARGSRRMGVRPYSRGTGDALAALPVPVCLVAYFLLISPVADLVLPQDVDAAAGRGAQLYARGVRGLR